MAVAIYNMVDALLNGKLEERLRSLRNEGKTVRAIAVNLNELLPDAVTVSYSTVHRWCDDLEIPRPEREAS